MRLGSRTSEPQLSAALLFAQPCVLFLAHAVVQSLKERRRLSQCLPRRQLARCPGADGPAIIVRRRLVTPRLFLVLDHLLGAKALAVVAQVLVKLLRRVRQDRRQDRLQIVDDAHALRDVDARRRGLRVLLDLEPGRFSVEACTACPELCRGEHSECVAVGLAGHTSLAPLAGPEPRSTRRGTCRRCRDRPPSGGQIRPFPGVPGPRHQDRAARAPCRRSACRQS
jgi:hypothetical protein